MSDESLKEDKPSTSKKIFKGTSHQPAKFVKNKHPELFKISPRPGGFYRHLAVRKNAFLNGQEIHDTSNKPKNSSTTRTNLSVGSHVNIRDVLETSIKCPVARTNFPKVDNKDDTVRMCSATISTVMMLAQKTYEDITAEHIVHSEAYFNWLKQGDEYPRNVEQLIDLLMKLKINGKIVTPIVDDDFNYTDVENEEDEPTDRVSMGDLIN